MKKGGGSYTPYNKGKIIVRSMQASRVVKDKKNTKKRTEPKGT